MENVSEHTTERQYELKKKLEKGWRPGDKLPTRRIKETVAPVTIAQALETVRLRIESERLSAVYERDLISLSNSFYRYLRTIGLADALVDDISIPQVNRFLEQFRSTGTNYMNRRRTLSSIFKRMVDATHKPLYLCCLLMYGCLLRPHQEIRMLKRRHFDDSLSKLSLSGNQNKSQRIRTVSVPEFVRVELTNQGVSQLNDEQNIFSKTVDVFNMSYFNTAWSRAKSQLIANNIITQDHTCTRFAILLL